MEKEILPSLNEEIERISEFYKDQSGILNPLRTRKEEFFEECCCKEKNQGDR